MSTSVGSVHMAQGIRALAFKNYPDACDHLSHAVEALMERYGELTPETGDALILYGRALILNAIASSAVLGGEAQQKEADEMAQNAVAGPSSTTATATDGTVAKGGIHPPVTSTFSFEGEPESDEEEEEEEAVPEGEEEEEDDFEMAFNMLDMARATFQKIKGTEAEVKLAQVHQLLGDIAMESEQFDQAVLEFTTSLKLLSANVPAYDRSLSAIHMHIALALDNLEGSVDLAISHVESSKAVLVLKAEHLTSLGGEKTEADIKELVDIQELIQAVNDKLEDLRTEVEEVPKTATEEALEALIKGATGPAKTQGIINNLNSLVKKKKPVPVVEQVAVQAESSGTKRKAQDAPGQTDEKKSKN